jgi:hypothetical protein
MNLIRPYYEFHIYPKKKKMIPKSCKITLRGYKFGGVFRESSFTVAAMTKLKGTVQRKLTGVLNGINRQLMIGQSVAWYF